MSHPEAKLPHVFAALAVAFLLGVPASAQQAEEPAHRLVLLDGTALEGTVKRIDADGKVTGPGLPDGLLLDRLRHIEQRFPADDKLPEPAAIVDLVGGGHLELSKLTIDEQQICHFTSAQLGRLQLPIDALRAIRFAQGKMPPAFAEALLETSDEDRIFVKLGGGVEPISGLIETIDEFNIVFDPGDGQRSVARDKVYGAVIALIGRPPDRTGSCLVGLDGGESLWGRVQGLADGKLTLQVAGGFKVTLPWDSVANVKIRSTRMVFLSDLEPVEARHQPLVTLKRPWQRDRSVGGSPLTLGQRTFEKGIGVASRSVLVFVNEGNYDLLAATIGIDAETEKRGDCIFIVEADGREAFRARVTGSDEPPARPINVDISCKERIALIVEPGEDLDLADHANWCDARFVRN